MVQKNGNNNIPIPPNDKQDEFALVEKLIMCSMIRNKRHYLVKRADKQYKNPEEPVENISETIIQDFHTKYTWA